jgi:hypothetical protein
MTFRHPVHPFPDPEEGLRTWIADAVRTRAVWVPGRRAPAGRQPQQAARIMDHEWPCFPLPRSRSAPINTSRPAIPRLLRVSIPGPSSKSRADPASNSKSPSPRLRHSLPQGPTPIRVQAEAPSQQGGCQGAIKNQRGRGSRLEDWRIMGLSWSNRGEAHDRSSENGACKNYNRREGRKARHSSGTLLITFTN